MRFETGGSREHFRATSTDGSAVASWTCKQLETAVHEHLASWFFDVYDKED
ncbi:MAG: hypothetical protein H0U23_00230 [Blastocatellia bacterium]|nr:hypothetical protein [Blastocatellia bacterium]